MNNLCSKSLNIIQISKYDSAGGGASRVAVQLTNEFISKGHNVLHYTRGSKSGFGTIRQPLYGLRTKKMMGWMAKKGWIDVIPFELPRLLFNFNVWRADVIHFHDISGTLSPFTIMFLSWFKRVVWTLHDASVLTAGCIQPMGCERYQINCHDCPQLGRWPMETKVDRSSFLFKFRRWCLKFNFAQLVSPSTWLAKLVLSESGKKVEVLANGIDTQIFHPFAWKNSSQAVNSRVNQLQQSTKFCLLIAASIFNDPLKGIETALSVVAKMPKDKFVLVLMGENDINSQDVDCELINFGYVQNESDKASIFSVCDGMIFCSKGENYPLILLESISCGVSVFALSVGGVAEILDLHSSSISTSNVASLEHHLLTFISAKKSRVLPTNDLLKQIDLTTCAERYVHLFRKIV
jgi:glycosyltransferase involved in cell wall biosynthesis